MNKLEFLSKLEKELEKRKITNITDILEDYSEHFDHKLSDGYTEEEICLKLGSIEDIATSYYSNPTEQTDKFKKACTLTGLAFIDITMSLVYILLCATVFVVGAFALVCLVTGFCLITTINIANLIPAMPYFGGLMLGVCMLALSVFVSTGTIYGFLMLKQCAKKYLRWHSNITNNSKRPPLSLYPNLQSNTRRILSRVCMLSFIIFSALFVVALIVLFIQAGFEPFWHKWNWFQ